MRRFRKGIPGFGIVAALTGIVLQAQSAPERRVNTGMERAVKPIAGATGTYHLMMRGATLEETTVSSLFEEILRARPASVNEVRALVQRVKIDGGMPNRISMNATLPKQTQGAALGERSADRGRPDAAGSGAASAAYAPTGRASAAQDIVIILCNTPAEEQEALRLFASITAAGEETSQTREKLKTRHDPAMKPVNNIRRAAAPGGREWILASEERNR